jgi:adenine-specific DNA-methyltransferase
VVNKKLTGSFYTPKIIADFLVDYLSEKLVDKNEVSILEPSAGDGNFIRAIYKHEVLSAKVTSVVAVERAKKELFKIKVENASYAGLHTDFLKYQKANNQKFSVALGNPPYIKAELLSTNQIRLCKEIHQKAKLSEKSINNIWPAFLLSCTMLLEDDGILAFVLPAELLQVKFSEELQAFLKNQFQRTEIFTFDDLLFDCKGQDTILLIGFKRHVQPGQFFTHIKDTKQLEPRNFILAQNSAFNTTSLKWSHHFLSADELTFINNIGNGLKNINHYCDSKPGIVTAANEFFIVDKDNERFYGLSRYAKPIIQKGLHVNGSVVFNKEDYKNLVEEGKRTKVLVFKDKHANRLQPIVEEYLKMGVEVLDLPERYKCIKRKNWFVIPNISTVPEGFFFKRSHHYPKLLKNKADVLVTDSAYKIEMKNGYKINHLIYSFYNTLTLTFAELNGRYYGGSVLELTPSEFKSLPIPNIAISTIEFNKYTKSFEKKSEINDVLHAHDYKILNTSLNLGSQEIEKIRTIYAKLISKRFRK